MASSSRCRAPTVPPFTVPSLYHILGLDIVLRHTVTTLIQKAKCSFR